MVYVLLVNQENEIWPDAAKGNFDQNTWQVEHSASGTTFEFKQKGFVKINVALTVLLGFRTQKKMVFNRRSLGPTVTQAFPAILSM